MARLLLVGLVLVLGGTSLRAGEAPQADPQANAVTKPPTQTEDEGQGEAAAADDGTVPAALRAYLDPATGKLVHRLPAGGAAPELGPRELEMVDHSDFGLVPQWMPGGYWVLDLGGRFRHLAVATVGPDGTVTTACVGDNTPQQEGVEAEAGTDGGEPTAEPHDPR